MEAPRLVIDSRGYVDDCMSISRKCCFNEVMQNWIFGVECGIMIKYGFTAGLV
jgi:hypothetical protein